MIIAVKDGEVCGVELGDLGDVGVEYEVDSAGVGVELLDSLVHLGDGVECFLIHVEDEASGIADINCL